MATVTLVEAAALCGLSAERLRELIEAGELPAQRVDLGPTSTYLVDEDALAIVGRPDATPDPPCARLETALEALQAALAARMAPTLESLPTSTQEPPPVRTLGGLSQGELAALAARVDRLLEPAAPVEPAAVETAAAEAPLDRPSWLRRLARRRT